MRGKLRGIQLVYKADSFERGPERDMFLRCDGWPSTLMITSCAFLCRYREAGGPSTDTAALNKNVLPFKFRGAPHLAALGTSGGARTAISTTSVHTSYVIPCYPLLNAVTLAVPLLRLRRLVLASNHTNDAAASLLIAAAASAQVQQQAHVHPPALHLHVSCARCLRPVRD